MSLIAAGVALAISAQAHASVIYHYEQVGSDVQLTVSGSVDVTGLAPVASISLLYGTYFPGDYIHSVSAGNVDVFAFASIEQAFSATANGFASAFFPASATETGDPGGIVLRPESGFGSAVGYFYLPENYSGQELSSTFTAFNRSLTSDFLGYGDYTQTLSNGEKVIVRVGPIPLPAAGWLSFAAWATLWTVWRRRRCST